MSESDNKPGIRVRRRPGGVPQSSPPVQSSTSVESQRRVYALPQELVDRIVEFQREKGYASEVEAVRRLLDDALKSRDDLTKIINRFLSRLAALRVVSESAKDVLVGHPLVKSIAFINENSVEAVSFLLKDGAGATIDEKGKVDINDAPHNSWVSEKPFGPGKIDLDPLPF